MRRSDSGFTLIETLITSLVLVTGLTAVAGLFCYSARASTRNTQQATATVLLHNKMEELRDTPRLQPGQYSEFVEIAADGSVIAQAAPAAFRILWQIEPSTPQRISVVVHGRQREAPGGYSELSRAAMLTATRF